MRTTIKLVIMPAIVIAAIALASCGRSQTSQQAPPPVPPVPPIGGTYISPGK